MGKPGRGRPRTYDRDEALASAMAVFAEKGFSATSLDDLAAATGMHRPSLYNAFGDKATLYRETLDHFVRRLRREVARRVVEEPDLNKALVALYHGALEEYFAVRPSRGCYFFCTAPVEALVHPEIRADVLEVIRELDATLAAKFADAQHQGVYSRDADPVEAARLAQAVLHSLAVRARAGETKASLRRMAERAASLLCADTGAA